MEIYKVFKSMLVVTALMSHAQGENFPTEHTWAAEAGKADSVVLKDQSEEGMPYFTKVEVYRKEKLIFTFKDSTVEISGLGEIFTEHRFGRGLNSYLIFRCSGRPSEDYFLVLEKSQSGYKSLGYTPASTAEIFGDIDEDGEFEIGGFENLHEGGATLTEYKENIQKEYKIFEVRPGFPLDKDLMKVMVPIVTKNCLREYKK